MRTPKNEPTRALNADGTSAGAGHDAGRLDEQRRPAEWRFGPVVDPARKTVQFRLFVPGRDAHSPARDAHGPPSRLPQDDWAAPPPIREVRVVGSFQHLVGGQDWDVQSGIVLTPRSQSEAHGGIIYECSPVHLMTGYFQYHYVVTYCDERMEPRRVDDPCSLHRSAGEVSDSSAFVI